MYSLETLVVTGFMQNCRILLKESKALILDPGGETDRILTFLKERQATCEQIWLTHSHLDHCGGVLKLKEYSNAPLYGHPDEAQMRANVCQIAQMYGLRDGYEDCPEPDYYLTGGETLQWQGYIFEVLFTPGHSPGHLCFFDRANSILFAGDTVFSGSVGRWDLPGGDQQVLLKSIAEKILTLPDTVRILPGHGPATTVGDEKAHNPYLMGIM